MALLWGGATKHNRVAARPNNPEPVRADQLADPKPASARTPSRSTAVLCPSAASPQLVTDASRLRFPCGFGRMRHKMFALFFLIVFSCAVGLMCVASLIQQRDLQLQRSAVRADGPGGLRGQMTNLLHHPVRAEAEADAPDLVRAGADPVRPSGVHWTLSNLSDYQCLGWRAQRDCLPDGGADPGNDRGCNATVGSGESGFCEVVHKDTGVRQRVLQMHCDSLRPEVQFTCDEFASLLSYGQDSVQYVHDPTFSLESCRQQLVEDQVPASGNAELVFVPNFRRGIVIVVYEKMLESVYASIRSLRSMGCVLPVELWYKPEETNPRHPLLQALTSDYNAYLREIRDPRATKFYTKTHAMFYSAFDQVLLLDADNFAVRDPTYLFDTTEFTTTGAIFWPDFWRPKKTIFNIQPTSLVWEILDLEPVDMFEQESGQVLVDRSVHLPALNVLMYYSVHPTVLERLRLVWGDKDLFRFAWLKTDSTFHMIETPPGSAGLKLPDQNIFCGVTMVQHDPNRSIVFLHRNQEKLSSENRAKVWAHVQDFQMGQVDLEEYDVRGANGGRFFPQFKRCYGKDIYYEKAFTVTPVEELPFADLEQQLLELVQDAGRIAGTLEEAEENVVVDVADAEHK